MLSARPKPYAHAAAAGLSAALFYWFFFYGIPFDFTGDLLYIYEQARTVSFGKLLGIIADPLTPAWFFSDDMIHLRPSQFLCIKGMHEFFSLTLPVAHAFAFAGMGLLCALLFLALWAQCQSKAFAWLGVVLYATFPSHVYSMISIIPLDFQPWEMLLMLSAVLLFWKLLVSRAGMRRFLLGLLGVVALTWLAIKLKSASKVLPFLLFGLAALMLIPGVRKFLSCAWRAAGFKRKLLALLAALAMFALAIPLLPQQGQSLKEQKSLHVNATYAAQRVFASRPEHPFPLLSLRRVPPGSLMESYGPLLSWIFLAALAWALLSRWKRPCGPEYQDRTDLFAPALLWFGLALAGFFLGEPPSDGNNRYLSYGLLPSAVLLFACLFPRGSASVSKAGLSILAALMTITIAQNIVLFAGWAKHMTGFQWAAVQAERVIFSDAMQRMPASGEELYDFHRRKGETLIRKDWEGGTREDLERQVREQGAVYYLTRSDAKEQENLWLAKGISLQPMGVVVLNEAPTPAMRVLRAFRKALGRPESANAVYIYKMRVQPEGFTPMPWKPWRPAPYAN